MKVGVTGGIGSGKTTVCNIFESLGVPVYYADDAAKELMFRNKELKTQIKKLLGNDAYHKNGRLNRAFVAGIIFKNKEKLEQLNQIVHPAVAKDAEEWHKRQKAKYTIKEAALLVENTSYKQLDFLIVVTAPVEMRIKRVVKRDKSNYDQVQARINNQLPEKEKKKVADYIIDNSGEVSLISQISRIHKIILTHCDLE